MFKKTSFIISVLLLLSVVLSACGAAPATNGTDTSLPSNAQTAVATVVSGANQTPGATPYTAGGTPSTITGTITSTVSMSGTPGVSTGSSNLGLTGYTLGWSGTWAEFFANIPSGDYTYSPDALDQKMKSYTPPFLLDVRDQNEIQQYGYIKGAVNISWRNVLNSLNLLPAQDQPIVVYSGNEYRGTVVMAALRMLGYTNAYVLDGGMESWLRAKKPAETLVPPTTPNAGTAPNIDQSKLNDLQYFITSNSYGITPKDLSGQLTGANKPFILDVRNPDEIQSNGSLVGSTNIPLKNIFTDLSKLPSDKNSPIIVYDTTGTRGSLAVMALQMSGYKNARSLYGGYIAWVNAGLPTTK